MRKDIQAFLGSFVDPIYIAIPQGESTIKKHGTRPKQSASLASLAELNNPEEVENGGYGLFISANAFIPKTPISRRAEDVSHLVYLYVDIDVEKNLSIAEHARAKQELYENILRFELRLPYTAVVHTKNGFQLLWKLVPPVGIHQSLFPKSLDEDKASLEARLEETKALYLKTLEHLRYVFFGDDAAADITRVLRIPGTWHTKDEQDPHFTELLLFRENQGFELTVIAKEAASLAAEVANEREQALLSKILPFTQSTEELPTEEILTFQRADAADIPPETFNSFFSEAHEHVLRQYPKTTRPSYQSLAAGVAEGGRNHALIVLASAHREEGKTEQEVLTLLKNYSGLSDAEVRSTVRSAFRPSKPYSFGWSSPVLSPFVTEEERLTLKSHYTSFLREKCKSWRLENKEKLKSEKAASRMEEDGNIDKARQEYVFTHFEEFFFSKHQDLYTLSPKLCLRFDKGHILVPQEELESLVRDRLSELNLLKAKTRSKVGDLISNVLFYRPRAVREEPLHESERLKYLLPTKHGLLDVMEEFNHAPTLTPYNPMVYVSPPMNAVFDVTLFEAAKERKTNFWSFLVSLSGGDETLALLLEEIIGYVCTASVEAEKAFIFFGEGANGKSTLLDVVQSMLGVHLTSNLTMEDLKDRFKVFGLLAKRLNIVDEISNSYFESDFFKRLVTGERVVADRKFLNPVQFRPHAKFVLAVNHLPKVNDSSYGFFRRVLVIPFEQTFTPNPGFRASLLTQHSLDECLAHAAIGLRRFIENGKKFTDTKKADASSEEYRDQNSPLRQFFLLHFSATEKTEDVEFYAVSSLDFFSQYRVFCSDLGFQAKSYANIVAELAGFKDRRFPLFRFDRAKNRIYGVKPKKPLLQKPFLN